VVREKGSIYIYREQGIPCSIKNSWGGASRKKIGEKDAGNKRHIKRGVGKGRPGPFGIRPQEANLKGEM